MKICKIVKKRIEEDITYKVCDSKYCCKKMKKYLEIEGSVYSDGLFTDKNTIVIAVKHKSREDNYGGEEYKKVRISYCPFCGEEVN